MLLMEYDHNPIANCPDPSHHRTHVLVKEKENEASVSLEGASQMSLEWDQDKYLNVNKGGKKGLADLFHYVENGKMLRGFYGQHKQEEHGLLKLSFLPWRRSP